jgi:hypothetical protein
MRSSLCAGIYDHNLYHGPVSSIDVCTDLFDRCTARNIWSHDQLAYQRSERVSSNNNPPKRGSVPPLYVYVKYLHSYYIPCFISFPPDSFPHVIRSAMQSRLIIQPPRQRRRSKEPTTQATQQQPYSSGPHHLHEDSMGNLLSQVFPPKPQWTTTDIPSLTGKVPPPSLPSPQLSPGELSNIFRSRW